MSLTVNPVLSLIHSMQVLASMLPLLSITNVSVLIGIGAVKTPPRNSVQAIFIGTVDTGLGRGGEEQNKFVEV